MKDIASYMCLCVYTKVCSYFANSFKLRYVCAEVPLLVANISLQPIMTLKATSTLWIV